MRAAVYSKYGPINEALRIDRTYPKPKAKPGQVLVRIHASSVNPVDWKILEGRARSLIDFDLPIVGGSDMSGTIESFGDAQIAARAKAEFDLKEGDEVFGMMLRENGAFADYVAVKLDYLAKKPRNLSHVEAATMPLVYLTSYQVLFDVAKLTRGQKVLILGASGGTGIAAVQLAKWCGAFVAGTCSKANEEVLKSMGADLLVDYKSKDWAKELKDQDYDLVYDAVGDRDAYIRSAQVLKQGGRFVTIIGEKGEDTSAPEAKKIEFKCHMVQNERSQLEEIRKGAEEGSLRPKIHAVYSFDELPRALQENKDGHVVGKIAIKIV